MKSCLLTYQATLIHALNRRYRQLCQSRRLVALLKGTLFIVFMVITLHLTAWADETDYLSGSQTQVVKNFGKDSTFIHYVYFAEVVIAAVTFIKAKNPMIFAGVLVLLILVPVLLNVALPSS